MKVKLNKRIISYMLTLCVLTSMSPCIIAEADGKTQNQTIAIGWNHYAMIKEDGSLWTWGSNNYGALGNGTTESSDIPVNIMNDVISVSFGDDYSAAIKEDGTLWMWGDNGAGQLGDKTSEDRYTPVKIMNDVRSVSTGRNVAAAVKTDGSLWTWGARTGFYSEQLGNDSERYTEEDYCTPMKIMDDVSSIFIGDEHCAAIKTDGSLWMWGDNLHGELGSIYIGDSDVPIKIMEDVSSVSLGSYNSAAIKTDGSLWMWGSNSYSLVDNTRTDIVDTPTKITDDVRSVSVGDGFCVVIKNDGTLLGWGNDTYEALGNGEGNDSIYGYKNAIKILGDIDSVVARGRAVAALSKEGFLWMWGDNDTPEPLQITTNVMIPKNNDNMNSAHEEPVKNNPVLSDTTSQSIALNNEVTLITWIDGIYNRVSADDFSVKSDDTNIVNLDGYNVDCGGVEDVYDETDITYITSISSYIKGVSSGTTTLTYYYQNKEIGKIDVSVEANIAKTISDETVLKATVLHNNNAFHYYKDTVESPSILINNQIKAGYTKGLANAYLLVDDLLSVLTLKFENGEDLNPSKYYETILADIIESDTAGIWDSVYSDWETLYDGYTNKIVQKVAGAVVDSKKVSTLDFVKNNKEKKVIETIIDYSDEQGVLKDVTIEVDILDKLSVTADLIDNFFEATDELYAYSAVQQEKIDVLKNISSNTKNKSLKSACENLIEDIKFAQENAVLYYVENFGKSTAYDLFEFSSGIVTGLVLQYITTDTAGVNPYIPGLKEAMAIIKAGRLISNSIINADAISKNVLSISAYAEIENEVKNYTTLAETEFVSDPTLENARKLISHADFMKATIIHSHDIFVKYVEDIKSSSKNLTITGNILSILSGDLTAFANEIKGADSSYDDLIASANRLKKALSNENFYSTDYLDVAQYISTIESTISSDWAKEYIDLAINTYYIVPEYLQGNYQNNITRAEFCTLLANTLEYYTGKGIEQLVEQSPYTTKLFEDTYYNYVYYMARLGIVNGVSETEFNPLGEISREEAAVMLYRAAIVVGYEIPLYELKEFDGVSSWANQGVQFVIDENIMTGTGNGFEPQGKYTKEQAITTFVRFIQNLR